MHDPKRVTDLHNPNNSLDELCSLFLAVMPFLNNSIKQFAPSTQLHHQVHEHIVFVGPFDPYHVWMLRQMVHDLNLPPNVFIVLPAHELALGDGLAGVESATGFFGTEICGPKLALPELFPHQIVVSEPWGLIRQNWCGLCWGWLWRSALFLHFFSVFLFLSRNFLREFFFVFFGRYSNPKSGFWRLWIFITWVEFGFVEFIILIIIFSVCAKWNYGGDLVGLCSTFESDRWAGRGVSDRLLLSLPKFLPRQHVENPLEFFIIIIIIFM